MDININSIQANPAPDECLRQALAIVIVRNKRKCAREAAEYKAKVQKLEAELQQQQARQVELQEWATSLFQNMQTAPSLQLPPADTSDNMNESRSSSSSSSIFLPPLIASGPQIGGECMLPLQSSYQHLQQQLVVAAAAGSQHAAAAHVLDGRAAALSDILLMNVHMLQRVSSNTQQPRLHAQAGSGCGSSGNTMIGSLPEAVASINSFILTTLLHVPKSSLSSAYMKQCAALLAASLTPGANSSSTFGVPNDGRSQHYSLQQQQQQDPEVLAVQVLHLLQALLEERAAASASNHMPAAPAASSPAAAAATAMLQQLSAFPGTALLLALAVAQQLKQHLQQLQEAHAAMASVQLCSFSSSVQQGEQALEAATLVFQASNQLLVELEGAIMQVPVWGVALASSTWTCTALEDLVTATSDMYRTCCGPQLQLQQPMLASQVCQLSASLATALQELATNADAPGMRVGCGAQLRCVTGGLCRRLRDLFMPAGC